MSQITSIRPLAFQRSQRMQPPPFHMWSLSEVLLIVQWEIGGEPANDIRINGKWGKKREAISVPKRLPLSDKSHRSHNSCRWRGGHAEFV